MKVGIYLAGATLLMASSAHALINVELTSNDLTFTLPSSGSTVFQVNGTVNLTDGWTNTTSTVFSPYDAGFVDLLPATFDSSYIAWFTGSQSTNYSGAIFDLTVSSSTPTGLYFLANGSSSGLAELDVTGQDPTHTYTFTDTEQYEVHVVAAPEPAEFLALAGMSCIVLLRRRRR